MHHWEQTKCFHQQWKPVRYVLTLRTARTYSTYLLYVLTLRTCTYFMYLLYGLIVLTVRTCCMHLLYVLIVRAALHRMAWMAWLCTWLECMFWPCLALTCSYLLYSYSGNSRVCVCICICCRVCVCVCCCVLSSCKTARLQMIRWLQSRIIMTSSHNHNHDHDSEHWPTDRSINVFQQFIWFYQTHIY